MAGYWNRPSATAQTLRGGWVNTGDLAIADENAARNSVDITVETVDLAAFQPSWSPDGRWVTYISWTNAGGHVYKVRANGRSNPVQLTRDAAFYSDRDVFRLPRSDSF